MATKKGTLVLIKVATKLLVGQNSLSYSKVATMIEISSKTSGNHSEFVSGRIGTNLSVTGIASSSDEDTNAGYWELDDAIETGTPVVVTFTEYSDETAATKVSGAKHVQVNALVSNLSREDPDNDASTFSCDLQITGAPDRQTNVASGQPVADAGANQTVDESTTVTLDGSASTNGGSGTLSYLWTAPAEITLSSTTIVNPTFTAPAQSTYAEYEITLQVGNGTLFSEIDKTVVTVVNVP